MKTFILIDCYKKCETFGGKKMSERIDGILLHLIKSAGCCTSQMMEPTVLVSVELFKSRMKMKTYIAEQFKQYYDDVDASLPSFQKQFDENYNKGLKRDSKCSCAMAFAYGDRKIIKFIKSSENTLEEIPTFFQKEKRFADNRFSQK